MPTFTTPYLDTDRPHRWLRGNHHGHSTVSDGVESPEALVAAYEGAGYDYLALSEHDILLDPARLESATGMCLVPAVETTSSQGQTLLHLGATAALPAAKLAPADIMARVHEAGGLFVFDHPNWRPRPQYATDALLLTMEGLKGMEIYCGVIERLSGEARATDRWDRLLSRGWRVFGHGTDDQHEPRDRFVAWNMVQHPEGEPVTPEAIVHALAEGRFYPSTGVTVEAVGTDGGGAVACVASDGDEVRWVSQRGIIVKKESGGRGAIGVDEVLAGVPDGDAALADSTLYVRAECLGHGNASAWTQPFWMSRD